MKSLTLKLIAALAALFAYGGAFAANPTRGLVLYSDIPSTYPEALEFVTITNTNAIIATAVLPNGTKQEIPRGGIIAIVNYPPVTPTESLPQEADAAIRIIQTLRPKYPQFAGKFDGAQTKWNNSLEVYRQTQRLAKAAPAPPSKSLTLEVDGIRYEQVVITSFDGATVGISHAAGAAGIPAIKLKPEQIAALNGTSGSVHIDPSKIVAATPAPSAASSVPRKAVGGQPTDRPTLVSVLSDHFVEPENLVPLSGPTYDETLEFINAKMGGGAFVIGFGAQTQKLIYKKASGQKTSSVIVFDPKALNAEVRTQSVTHPEGGFTSHNVILQGLNGRKEFTTCYKGQKGTMDHLDQSSLTIPVANDLDAQKVATAFSHLIQLFGAKSEAF